MASLLASLDSLEKVAGKKSKKEGRKHSKREKEAKKNSEDGVPRLVQKKEFVSIFKVQLSGEHTRRATRLNPRMKTEVWVRRRRRDGRASTRT